MAILQLPAAGWSKEQLQYVVSLLEKYVVGHRKGIQILCPRDLLENVTSRKQFLTNVRTLIPPSYTNTFHAPISPHVHDPHLNLTCRESIAYYRAIAAVVKEAGGSVLVIHCNAVFSHQQWKEPLTDYGYVQKQVFDKIHLHLKEIVKDLPLTIAVENMPFPLKGDKTSKISEIPFDPCLLTVEQMKEFIERAPPQLGFAFDTSHYGIASTKINEMQATYGTSITQWDLEEEGLKGVYPPLIVKQPSMTEAFKLLQKSGRIVHLQMADAGGQWSPHQEGTASQHFVEGAEIGKGNHGPQLLDLARLIHAHHPNLPISLDINVRDYLQREEQVRSLQAVLRALRW